MLLRSTTDLLEVVFFGCSYLQGLLMQTNSREKLKIVFYQMLFLVQPQLKPVASGLHNTTPIQPPSYHSPQWHAVSFHQNWRKSRLKLYKMYLSVKWWLLYLYSSVFVSNIDKIYFYRPWIQKVLPTEQIWGLSYIPATRLISSVTN